MIFASHSEWLCLCWLSLFAGDEAINCHVSPLEWGPTVFQSTYAFLHMIYMRLCKIHLNDAFKKHECVWCLLVTCIIGIQSIIAHTSVPRHTFGLQTTGFTCIYIFKHIYISDTTYLLIWLHIFYIFISMHTRMCRYVHTKSLYSYICRYMPMGWLRLVGSLKL